MHILITGAAGFIGQIVARELLNDPSHTVLLADIIEPPVPNGVKCPQNAKTVKVDLCDSAAATSLISPDLDAVFVFHGIMSSGSEANYDLGMRANVDATRSLLDAIRTSRPGIRVIYASGGAVYGQPLPAIVTDSVLPTPQSSYGAEKLICEYLINDYTRRGFIDGLSLRFPTISVRAGKPTQAASSFLSGMIREPFHGQECIIPITDRSFENWICSPQTLLFNLMHSLAMSTDGIPRHIRAINVPGICVSIQEMMEALAAVGGKDKLRFLREEDDEALIPILKSWPVRYDNSQAMALGMKRDESFEQVVRDYKDSLALTA